MKKAFSLISVISFILLTLAIAPCRGSESSYSNVSHYPTFTGSVVQPDPVQPDPVILHFTTEDPSPKKITLRLGEYFYVDLTAAIQAAESRNHCKYVDNGRVAGPTQITFQNCWYDWSYGYALTPVDVKGREVFKCTTVKTTYITFQMTPLDDNWSTFRTPPNFSYTVEVTVKP